LADSIVFDNVNKEKILPGFNFNKKNINFNIVDKKLSDRYEDIFGSESLTKKWIKI
jgi:ABC-type amino acid transport system permease subunit